MNTSRVKIEAVNALRWASGSTWYRKVGAAMVRNNPAWLLTFTRCSKFSPAQFRGEWLPFLEVVASRKPTRVLEIGSLRGGTFFMMAQVAAPDALLAAIDLQLPTELETFAHARQRIVGITGDSTSAVTCARAHDLFPDGVDVLFIDGDHAYEGVTRDCDLYQDLLRPGGVMAFHDVVPDDDERTGTPTMAWSGGVPKFWSEFKAEQTGWEIREFVNSWDQDGFGIGVAIKR